MSRQQTAINQNIKSMRIQAFKCFISKGKTVERCCSCSMNSLCAVYIATIKSGVSIESIKRSLGVE